MEEKRAYLTLKKPYSKLKAKANKNSARKKSYGRNVYQHRMRASPT